jgi:hypothetical protein
MWQREEATPEIQVVEEKVDLPEYLSRLDAVVWAMHKGDLAWYDRCQRIWHRVAYRGKISAVETFRALHLTKTIVFQTSRGFERYDMEKDRWEPIDTHHNFLRGVGICAGEEEEVWYQRGSTFHVIDDSKGYRMKNLRNITAERNMFHQTTIHIRRAHKSLYVFTEDGKVACHETATDQWKNLQLTPQAKALTNGTLFVTDTGVFHLIYEGNNGRWDQKTREADWQQVSPPPVEINGEAALDYSNHRAYICQTDRTAMWAYDWKNDRWDPEPIPFVDPAYELF